MSQSPSISPFQKKFSSSQKNPFLECGLPSGMPLPVSSPLTGCDRQGRTLWLIDWTSHFSSDWSVPCQYSTVQYSEHCTPSPVKKPFKIWTFWVVFCYTKTFHFSASSELRRNKKLFLKRYNWTADCVDFTLNVACWLLEGFMYSRILFVHIIVVSS